MKKIKIYHIKKYTEEEFVKKYSTEEEILLRITSENFINKHFGNKKYTLSETRIMLEKLNNTYDKFNTLRHCKRKDSHFKKMYKDKILEMTPKEFIDYLRIFEKKEVSRDDALHLMSTKKYGDTPYNLVRDIEYLRGELNIKALYDYANNYFDTIDEFIITMVSSELCFTYKYEIFEKTWETFREIFDYQDIEKIVTVLTAIHKNAFNEEAKIQFKLLTENQINIILKLVGSKDIWVDYENSEITKRRMQLIIRKNKLKITN